MEDFIPRNGKNDIVFDLYVPVVLYLLRKVIWFPLAHGLFGFKSVRILLSVNQHTVPFPITHDGSFNGLYAQEALGPSFGKNFTNYMCHVVKDVKKEAKKDDAKKISGVRFHVNLQPWSTWDDIKAGFIRPSKKDGAARTAPSEVLVNPVHLADRLLPVHIGALKSHPDIEKARSTALLCELADNKGETMDVLQEKVRRVTLSRTLYRSLLGALLKPYVFYGD